MSTRDDAERFAGWLDRQVAVVASLASLGLIAIPAVTTFGQRGFAPIALMTAAAVFGLIALGLSALLAFDGALFRLMARHGDDAAGGRAVDEFLAAARLKEMPLRTRTLQERIGGTRRLVSSQRIAVILFVASYALAFLVSARALP